MSAVLPQPATFLSIVIASLFTEALKRAEKLATIEAVRAVSSDGVWF
jgi:hypothetical protein